MLSNKNISLSEGSGESRYSMKPSCDQGNINLFQWVYQGLQSSSGRMIGEEEVQGGGGGGGDGGRRDEGGRGGAGG